MGTKICGCLNYKEQNSDPESDVHIIVYKYLIFSIYSLAKRYINLIQKSLLM